MCYEFVSIFTTYKQLKVIVIVIVIGKMKCNCNLIVIDINVIDPCLMGMLEVIMLAMMECMVVMGMELGMQMAPGFWSLQIG